jgi:myosin heavy subunit
LFNQHLFEEIKSQILNNKLKDNYPHIYVLAGRAYISMGNTGNKQAIVISG